MIDDDMDFSAAMTPKKLGRPPKIKRPENSPSPKNSQSYNNIYIDKRNNIEVSSICDIDYKPEKISNINIKDKLTIQELSFLEIYFNSKHLKGENRVTIDKAMISAGYGNLSERNRYLIARKIVQKYEIAAPDARKIFQALGFGPVRTALEIIRHAEESPPTVSLNALKLAAACQGMIEQPETALQGITININTAPAPPSAPPAAPGPAGVIDIQAPPAAAPAPRRPLQITR